ncbi:MAG: hypothetical protein BWK76_13855 [Desulfobulbaceae bacterium A2]|nr:MAG: hypothetical protein BWK76_13855 [Desulfobulbaceae bacterium A2]
MPNTLAHIGVQGLLHRTWCSRLDLRWALVGCVLPDLSWILQRLLIPLVPVPDLLDLRLYVMVQASLVLCLLPAAALALCARRPLAAFLLMAGNSMLHLLLDAVEIKWANGVHLLAPVSWRLTAFGLCWPESLWISGLTLLGLLVLILQGRDLLRQPSPLIRPGRGRGLVVLALLLAYLLLPFAWLDAAEVADNHFVRTLRQVAERPGRDIAFDRCRYDPALGAVRIFSGEVLPVRGLTLTEPATLSLNGRFVDHHVVEVHDWHRHWPLVRDLTSGLGLAAVLLLLIGAGRDKVSGGVARRS